MPDHIAQMKDRVEKLSLGPGDLLRVQETNGCGGTVRRVSRVYFSTR